MPIRVVLAEDNDLVLEGVATLLGHAPEIAVVATASDHDTLLAAVEDQEPDVVVTDIRMPPTGTDEGIRAGHRHRVHQAGGLERLPNGRLSAMSTDHAPSS